MARQCGVSLWRGCWSFCGCVWVLKPQQCVGGILVILSLSVYVWGVGGNNRSPALTPQKKEGAARTHNTPCELFSVRALRLVCLGAHWAKTLTLGQLSETRPELMQSPCRGVYFYTYTILKCTVQLGVFSIHFHPGYHWLQIQIIDKMSKCFWRQLGRFTFQCFL